MYFTKDEKSLTGRQESETLVIEAWGKNAFRVRATQYPHFNGNDWALSEFPVRTNDVEIDEKKATIRNGKISASVNPAGILTFYKDGRKILREYSRNWGSQSRESCCLKVNGREFDPITGGDYHLNVRFESRDGEKIYGMGQYQSPYLDLKGCILELAQRNSQISVPFSVSSLGYGFLWNNPAIGKVTFGKNYTEWHAEVTDQMDYWITADDTPGLILQNYTEVSGRAPEMPSDVLGLWQCKLRYRTQEEVLEVARKYKQLGIPLDVIIIDFFHWTLQGEWKFDPKYWPDPKAMVDELHAMGTKVMVSIWPTVDQRSENYRKMLEKGLLIRTENGLRPSFEFYGNTVFYDATNPEARAYLWNQCENNYRKYGVDMFWLDEAEPEYGVYDFDNYRYFLGPNIKIGNVYPKLHAKTFYDGLKSENETEIVSLVRSAWAGSQKYAALVWSGDVPTTFESFRDQLVGALNMGMAGIPWWTSDIGGFGGGNIHDPAFVQLEIRWFQFAVFCPILRMHGDRDPHDIPALSGNEDGVNAGGGFLWTGQSNELWSYGDEAFGIFKKYLKIRLNMKPYLEKLMEEAHETGAPLMRAMFYEFPEDQKCWEIRDQFMFGSEYLVAPILYADSFSREVYLPAGSWKNTNDGKTYPGGRTVTCNAPIDSIPVFQKTGETA